jgi:hypothetical protein
VLAAEEVVGLPLLSHILVLGPTEHDPHAAVVLAECRHIDLGDLESIAQHPDTRVQREMALLSQQLRVADQLLQILGDLRLPASSVQVALDHEAAVAPALDDGVLSTRLDARAAKHFGRT